MKQLTDEYQLVRQLGRGGMGEVWAGSRAGPEGMWMTCAIKLLHREMAETPRDLQMFLNEARIASQLDHSRIVKVFDVGTADDGRPFIVMEWVDGVNLRAFTAEAQKHGFWPLELDIVTYIVGEILAALEYAHDRTIGGMDAGVIHYDVTPGNIMISSSGEVKLTDFGISRFAANAGPLSRSIGTPRYMSPEQITGFPRRETDIYSLGVVLHELLDGRRYLEGYGQEQFQAQVLLGSAPDLTRTGVPAWLEDLRRRMLANRADQRPSARGVRTVLIENCPRYMVAADELKNRYYPRLIGRKHSGMTELLDFGAIETAIRKQMLGASPKPNFSTTSATGAGPRDREQAAPTAVGDSSSADDDVADVPLWKRRTGSQSPANYSAETHVEPPPLADFSEGSASELSLRTRTSDRRDQLRLPVAETSVAEPDRIEPTEQLSLDDMRRAKQLQASRSDSLADAPREVTQPLAPTFEQTKDTSSSTLPQVAGATSPTLSGSVAVLDAPPRRLPWSMIAALLIICGLSGLVVALLVKMSRTPEHSEVAVETSDTGSLESEDDETTGTIVNAETSESESSSTSTSSGDETETGSESESDESESETETDTGGDDTPPPPPKSKLPKVGIRFLFDVDSGQVKIAGRSSAIIYGSAYVKVSSGKKHTISLKPEGAKEWQSIGKIDAKPIVPDGYLVKFQKGKLTIEVVKGGTQ